MRPLFRARGAPLVALSVAIVLAATSAGVAAATAAPPPTTIRVAAEKGPFALGFDNRVTVRGTVHCTPGSRISLSVSLSQTGPDAQNGNSTIDQPCARRGTPWSFPLGPALGKLRPGPATLEVQAFGLDEDPVTATLTRTVTVTPPRESRGGYYVALGDSLVTGFGASPGHGYVDLLARRLRARAPGVTLVDFGCNGETTTTMLTGEGCGYPGGSQYAAATAFLAAHRGKVKLVTLDIGGNDIEHCIFETDQQACATPALATIHTQLGQILAGLRAAGGRRFRLAAMTYFDPAIAWWLTGPDGQAKARASVAVLDRLNAQLTADYRAAGAVVADVAGAYRADDFDTQVRTPLGVVPVNVALSCVWLDFTCTSDGPNGLGDDADDAGYRAIAAAFGRALGWGGRIPPVPFPVVGPARVG